jgi:cation diffusion facilitator family transporter
MGAAGLLNFGLGYYLLRVGRAEGNMILISNGKHTLTDVWTTGSVLVTLAIIEFTQWLWLDSVISIALAFYIGYEGYRLAHYSISGLMDSKDTHKDQAIKQVLKEELPENAISCHNLRHRTTGNTTWIEFHVLFNDGISLQEAHHEATILERKIMNVLPGDAVVTIHLEPRESHEEDHQLLKGINEKRSLEDFS